MQLSISTLLSSLSKHFEDLQNFLSLLKRSFDTIKVLEHKITKDSKNPFFNLAGYLFCFNETEASRRGTGFFISNNLLTNYDQTSSSINTEG